MIKFYCQTTVGAQIADAWYAKHQALKTPNLHEISVVSLAPGHGTTQIDANSINIAIGNQFDDNFVDQRHRFDLVFLCNAGEPLEVSSPKIKSMLQEHNVYLIANSFLSASHALYHKVIWHPHNIIVCKNYWTQHFYPQFFQNQKLATLDRNGSIAWINGSNRANRHYFWQRLQQVVPTISGHSNPYSLNVNVLNDCQWESAHDQEFRERVNDLYSGGHNESYSIYENDSLRTGLDEKFGNIHPGFFLLPLYYQNRCIIFPESSWINDQLTLTEKSLKCFFAGSLAWPICGANTNLLYNQIGFRTAWNLLPEHLQSYDSEHDHFQRTEGLVQAIKWVSDNPDVLTGARAQEIIRDNRERFLSNALQIDYVDRFDHIINSTLSQRYTQ